MTERSSVLTAQEATPGLWPLLRLSSRVRFALKTALAITIAYMVPLAMGWNQPYQGAVAIMVIAAAGPLRESLGKGVMRIVGTLAGAAVGLGLIALFPQDPFYYFFALSLVAMLLVYAYYAYRGDGTFLLVTLMVAVLIFNEGKVDDRFLYALDRSWTTAFGIFVYAMVNLYLWPEKSEAEPLQKARQLTQSWRAILQGDKEGGDLKARQKAWEQSLTDTGTVYPGGIAMDGRRWERLHAPILRIGRILSRMELLASPREREALERMLPQSADTRKAIEKMIRRVEEWWRAPSRLKLPPEAPALTPSSDNGRWKTLPPSRRMELLSLAEEYRRLHDALRELMRRLDRIASPEPDPREWLPERGGGRFITGDPELWRSTLRSMLVFWTGLLLWYYLHPPLGYTVAGLGLVLSLVAFGLYVNPLALIFIYTLSFLFSFIGYVWILPQLYEGWQLGLYIFGYMFLSFWLVPVPLALFFALGLSFQYILNDRIISFEIFLAVLLLFYLFLGLLLLFYYLPDSNRPERAFLRAKKDWWRRLGRALCISGRSADVGAASLERMKFHSVRIDRRYFSGVSFEALERFLREAERLTELATLLRESVRRLPKRWRSSVTGGGLCGAIRTDDPKLRQRLRHKAEELERFLTKAEPHQGEGEWLPELAEYLTLLRRTLRSLDALKRLEKETQMNRLRWSRF